MKISDEVVEALRFLREYPPVERSVKQALDVLDNAGVFAEVDREIRLAELDRLVEARWQG